MDKGNRKLPYLNFKITMKKIIIFGIIFLIIFIILKIFLFFALLPKEINELNNNINLPYKFAAPMSDYNLNSYKLIRRGGCYSIFDDFGNCFAFGGYPDASSKYKFIGFRTTNSTIHVFGFAVGDDMDKAKKILIDKGYKEKRKYDDLYIYYVKGRVKILLDGNKTIESIQVDLISTNWQMKQFK